MSKRQGHVLLTTLGMIALAGAGAGAFFLGGGGGQDTPAVPALFAKTYASGHELAGFSGRPMVLVFADSRVAGWNEFLVECEGDPSVAKFLSERFVGVFVDKAADDTRAKEEPSIFELYGNPAVGTTLVKDLRGPLLGILEGEYTCRELLGTLQMADQHLTIQRSPLYEDLLRDPNILSELVAKEESAAAKVAVRCFKALEGDAQKVSAVNAKAAELGISQ